MKPNDLFNVLNTRYTKVVDTKTYIEGDSLTKQEFKEESDINVMVKRFLKGHDIPLSTVPAQYIDNTAVPTFETALNTLIIAQDYFDDLPVELRKRFNQDPKAMLEFVNDPANESEAIKLGLLPAKEVSASSGASPQTAGAPSGAADVRTGNTGNAVEV